MPLLRTLRSRLMMRWCDSRSASRASSISSPISTPRSPALSELEEPELHQRGLLLGQRAHGCGRPQVVEGVAGSADCVGDLVLDEIRFQTGQTHRAVEHSGMNAPPKVSWLGHERTDPADERDLGRSNFESEGERNLVKRAPARLALDTDARLGLVDRAAPTKAVLAIAAAVQLGCADRDDQRIERDPCLQGQCHRAQSQRGSRCWYSR